MPEQTTSKVISKRYDVLPTAFHVTNPNYFGFVTIGGQNYYTENFPTKTEAEAALRELKEALDYDSIDTMEGQGFFPERAEKIRELYEASSRTCGTYSGLYQEFMK